MISFLLYIVPYNVKITVLELIPRKSLMLQKSTLNAFMTRTIANTNLRKRLISL